MRVALIPPLGWETYSVQSTGVQMALAIEACFGSSKYTTAYKLHAAHGDLVMLDNGEAEGRRTTNRELVRLARSINATELVLPDVMGNRHATVRMVSDFFNGDELLDVPSMLYMAVAQGDTLLDAQRCVEYFAEFRPHNQSTSPITTIGIPRRLIVSAGSPSARIDFANWINDEYGGRFAIHLLGAVSSWPQEVKFANKYAPRIRSIDTSLPFNFAIAGKVLPPDGNGLSVVDVVRHPKYLSGSLQNIYQKLVEANITTYKGWAA